MSSGCDPTARTHEPWMVAGDFSREAGDARKTSLAMKSLDWSRLSL